jgi:4-amino-4-deoxy-L-arabinose transferase-like glycosyltransferase
MAYNNSHPDRLKIPLIDPLSAIHTNLKPVKRRELILLIIIVMSGLVLRAWDLSNVGLNHFDEGVYVFSALGLSDSNQPLRLYPGQYKFSPLLYPGLVGLGFDLLGRPVDTVAFGINVLIGTLTIVLIWLIGRSWFEPTAGIAAAAFLALNEYYIALSRTALTDVAFAFFFFVAIYAINRTFERRLIITAILAGLAIGLAWNTKYHGFFAILISIAALVLYHWANGSKWPSIKHALILESLIILIALACYIPWASYIQAQPGGYSALIQYQRGLINDPLVSREWLHNLRIQVEQQLFLEGPVSRLSVFVALFCAWLVSKARIYFNLKFFIQMLLLAFSALVLGSFATVFILSILAIPILLKKPHQFSTWMLLSLWAIWGFATPFYHPYARLVLPFLVVAFISGGFWISHFFNANKVVEEFNPAKSKPILYVAGVIILLPLVFIMPVRSNPWNPSRSIADAALAMQAFIPPGSRVVVIGEPSLAFYLHLADRPAFERTEEPAALESIKTPVYLVTGIYTQRAPVLRDEIKKLRDRLTLLGTFPMVPNDIRLLDDFNPQSAGQFRNSPDNAYDFSLYYFQP